MRLVFSGAAHEVTGSCHYLEVGTSKFLVDCGMEQGVNIYENVDPPVPWSDIQFVLVTHSHIDHVGMLPYIYARGFKGRVIATNATCDLCNIMLKDSAHIQEMDAEWKNRKARRAGRPEVPPLYEMNDALGVLEHFEGYNYDEIVEVNDEVSIRFTDIGHLLGSASIEIWMKEDGVEKKIVFSGDIGNFNKPLIRDPIYTKEADYAVMESTYGDRYHGDTPDYVAELAEIIERTFARGGNVVIPAFAVGRTQELLYFIRQIKEQELITTNPNFEVYVDSPLAVEATSIFGKNVKECFDEEAKALVENGINPLSFKGLKLSITSDDSKEINFDPNPKVIISASGMCEAGRIRHHLKHNLWREDSTIVFAGYQAVGTLGRSLLEGATNVKLFGEPVEVRAEIVKISGISGHADKKGLIHWVTGFDEKQPKRVFVVHGEDQVCDSFAECLEKEHGLPATAPYSGTIFNLITGEFDYIAEPVYVKKKDGAKKRAMDVFGRLLLAGERLMAVIRKNEGLSNKETARFTDQINALCDKWDR